MSDSNSQLPVSKKYPSLAHLQQLVTSTAAQLRTAAAQLSKGGTTNDIRVLEASTPPPTASILGNLEQLQQEIAERSPDQTTDGLVVEPLGMRDHKIVAQAIDLLIVFGIQPRLQPGVGVPLSLRVRSDAAQILTGMLQRQSQQLLKYWDNKTKDTESGTLDLPLIAHKITGILERRISWGTADVAHILLNKYTPDVFALLMQTAYAPIPPINIIPPVGYLDNIEVDKDRRVMLQRAFTRMFTDTNVYLLLETLTSLLNSATTYKPTTRWFCTLCSRFLTRVLMRPGGVRTTIDFFMSNDTEITAEKLDRLARLILAAPDTMDKPQYLLQVVPQLLTLVRPKTAPKVDDTQDGKEDVIGKIMNTEAVAERVQVAAVYTVRQMAETQPDEFQRLVVEPINTPIKRWFATRTVEPTKTPSKNVDDPVKRGLRHQSSLQRPLIQVVDQQPDPNSEPAGTNHPITNADDLRQTLSAYNALVLDGVCSTEVLAALIIPVFSPLLHWYAEEPDTTIKQTLSEVLIAALSRLPSQAALTLVLNTIQLVRCSDHVQGTGDWPVFVSTTTGSTQMVWQSTVEQPPPDDNDDNDEQSTGLQEFVPMDALLDLISNTRKVLGDVFVTLLREQQAALELLDQGTNDELLLRKWWLVSQATLAIVDRFGPAALTRHQDVLAFIFDTLDRFSSMLLLSNNQQGGDEDLEDLEDRVGGAEMAILAMMMLGHVMAISERQAFDQMAPGLAAQLDPDAPKSDTLPPISWDTTSLRHLRGIRHLLDQLHGDVLPVISQAVNETKTQISMILALHGSMEEPTAESPDQKTSNSTDSVDIQRFNAALRDVRSSLVPVQAHGVLELRNLVLAKTPILNTERIDATVAVFLDTLRADDSYLYLNAIRGLAALTDTSGHLFVPRLIALYRDSRDLDEFLRFGEALSQTIHRAGQTFSRYAQDVVPQLMDILQNDKEEMRRFSALSILGMAAEVDPLGLHKWADIITATLDDLLAVEKQQQQQQSMLRRAAVVFWLSLVRGYGPRVRSLMDRRSLLTIYRCLRPIADSDNDPVSQHNAQLALEELDDNVKDQLFANFL